MNDEQKTKALAIFAHYGEQSQVRQTIEVGGKMNAK